MFLRRQHEDCEAEGCSGERLDEDTLRRIYSGGKDGAVQ